MDIIVDIAKKYSMIAVVGMAKNAGKTVALNALIDDAMMNDIPIGLTSIGRDGEQQDIVTNTEKPLIYVNEGTLVATSEMLFNRSEARLEVLNVTDESTSMGPIIIGRVKSSGHVQLAGPTTNLGIKRVSQTMLNYGAQLVIVDGALDRVSSASPSITEACILATGATLSRDMQKVVNQTVHQVGLFHLSGYEGPDKDRISQAIEQKEVILIDRDGQVDILSIKTALTAGKIIGQAIDKETRTVVIPGALVERTLLEIIEIVGNVSHVDFVIQDATRIFVEYFPWERFRRKGFSCYVMNPINLVALTVNPFSPSGYYFDGREFRRTLQEMLKPLPVIDCMDAEVM